MRFPSGSATERARISHAEATGSRSASRRLKRPRQLLRFDQRLQRQLNLGPEGLLAGLDEAGRGPLAGPLVASALVLHHAVDDLPIDDSKVLAPSVRESIFRQLLPRASIGIGMVHPEEIDRLGLQPATGLAMRRALGHLPVTPRWVLIDGPWVPSGCWLPALPIVDGDAKSLVIACASIVAKVIRDRIMGQIHLIHPEYGFARHKGYGTREHFKILRIVGPSLFHRFSFRPIRSATG